MHSLKAAAGGDGRHEGVGTVLEGQRGWELLPIDPQGHPGCAQATSSRSHAPDRPITLPGDTAAVAGEDSRTAGGPHACPRASDTAVPGSGRTGPYLDSQASGHSEPLTITRQLLPAKRLVPWSER